MNRLCTYLLVFVGLIICFGIIPTSSFAASKLGGDGPLQQARYLYKSDIKLAFKYIEDEIKRAKSRKNYRKLAECYAVLARVNEYNNLIESAENNLAEATKNINLIKSKNSVSEIHAEIALVKASIKYREKDLKSSLEFFKKAQKSENGLISRPAMEGAADVLLEMGDNQKAIQLYDNLIQFYIKSNDDQTKSRLNSKKATALANMGNIDDAVSSYADASYTNARTSKTKRSDKYIDEANDAILENSRKAEMDPVKVTKQTIESMESKKLPEAAILKQKVNLAEVLIEETKFDEAETQLDEVLSSNNLEVSDKEKALELKSELNVGKKNYKDAYEYLNRKKSTDFSKSIEKDSKIEIIKGQAKLDKELKDIDLREKDYQIDQIRSSFLMLVIGALGLLTLAALIFSFSLWKNVKAKNKANQKLELKSLRTQMNPHFIFNSMNSINNFISQNDERAANKYIADFSKLIRKIMDFSQKEFISLEEEIELLEIYLRLEQSRFRDKFEYNFKKDPSLNELQVDIPPMLIQPFLENAIWHGLRYKEEKGFLQVSINQSKKGIYVEIEDNGIGRKKSLELKTKNQKQYKSTGMSNIKKRIALINYLYKLDYKYEVIDGDFSSNKDVGTIVKIYLNGKPKIDKA